MIVGIWDPTIKRDLGDLFQEPFPVRKKPRCSDFRLKYLPCPSSPDPDTLRREHHGCDLWPEYVTNPSIKSTQDRYNSDSTQDLIASNL